MSYHLSFISDTDLFNHVTDTVKKYRFEIDLDTLNDNLLDPIKLSFDSLIYQGSVENSALEATLENEIQRQIDKSNTNHIGYFHQNIFKYIGQQDGWNVPTEGFDVENSQKHIFVEMKNKHNTMNSSSSAKTYMRMQNKLLNDRDATCMLVEVIAKHSQNIEWQCTIDKQKVRHEKIRRTSIDKFYEIVTGQHDAFMQLCRVLPKVIADVIEQNTQQLIKNTVIEELQNQKTQNILQNLYLLAFKEYQGFKNFKLEK